MSKVLTIAGAVLIIGQAGAFFTMQQLDNKIDSAINTIYTDVHKIDNTIIEQSKTVQSQIDGLKRDIKETTQRTEQVGNDVKNVKRTIKRLNTRMSRIGNVKMYRVKQKITLNQHNFDCLVKNIYYEAAGEPFSGMIAVAQVTHVRQQEGTWGGNTICKVVFKYKAFSWTLDKRKLNSQPDENDIGWIKSVEAAKAYTEGLRIAGLENSINYHATWMQENPWWVNDDITPVLVVGQHVFYERAS